MYRPDLYASADTEASEQYASWEYYSLLSRIFLWGVSEVIKQKTAGFALKWLCFERGRSGLDPQSLRVAIKCPDKHTQSFYMW
jgi:hypothetical protein